MLELWRFDGENAIGAELSGFFGGVSDGITNQHKQQLAAAGLVDCTGKADGRKRSGTETPVGLFEKNKYVAMASPQMTLASLQFLNQLSDGADLLSPAWRAGGISTLSTLGLCTRRDAKLLQAEAAQTACPSARMPRSVA